MLELLEKLTEIAAPSGSEGGVADFLQKELAPYAELRIDALGNLIAFKKGAARPKRKLMLAAHMDEVGFIVTAVTPEGLLRCTPVGGIDPRIVAGRRVLVGKNRVPAVFGMKVLHLTEGDEKNAVPPIEKLFLDIGASSKEEAEKAVQPGDTAVFDSDFVRFGDGFLKARALDDRMGCAILAELVKRPIPFDCTFVFTVQEEVGARGAKAAAFAVAPEAAIVIESTTAADIAGVPAENRVCCLGRGPVLSFIDRGTLYDRGLYELALSVAKKDGIACQLKLAAAGGNDAASIHISGKGVRTLAVSLPCRYLHSSACVIKWSDAEETLRLVSGLADAVAGGQ